MISLLETNRILLKPFVQEDLELLHDTFTNPFVRKHLWDNEIISIEQTNEILEKNRETFDKENCGLWKIITKDHNAYVGFAGLWRFFHEDQPQLLFGLMPTATRLGYATEASLAIISYAFKHLKLEYLIASFDSINKSSERVCQRINMKKVDERVINGKATTFYRIQVAG